MHFSFICRDCSVRTAILSYIKSAFGLSHLSRYFRLVTLVSSTYPWKLGDPLVSVCNSYLFEISFKILLHMFMSVNVEDVYNAENGQS